MRHAPCTILSGSTCEAFTLVQISSNCRVYQMDGTSELTKDYIVDHYKDVFTGLGKLPGHCHIDLDSALKPVQHTPRKVHMTLKIELKIEQLQADKIISKVTHRTPWSQSRNQTSYVFPYIRKT